MTSSSTVKPDSLSDVCCPWFALLATLSSEFRNDDQRRPAEDIRRELQSELWRIERDVQQLDQNLRIAFTQRAKYILVVSADGVLRDVYGPGWKLLESELFESSVGGDEFFNRLRDPGHSDPEMQELFYFAMATGFCGKHGDDENCDAIMTGLMEECSVKFNFDQPKQNEPFTPEASRRLDGVSMSAPTTLQIAYRVIASVFIISFALVLAFAAFTARIDSIADLAAEIAFHDQE
jgi:type IV/VI secretion system ImpK/VasF family protein